MSDCLALRTVLSGSERKEREVGVEMECEDENDMAEKVCSR